MRLFVSYAHENSALVQPVVDVLRAASHFVWFDEQILPGQNWKHELSEKIHGSDVFLYALTPQSVASEWCQWEFAVAAGLQKSIVPCLLQPVAEMPPALKPLQYANLTEGITALAAARLLGAIGLLQKVSEAPSAPIDPSGVPARAWDSAKHWTDHIIPTRYQPQNETEHVLGKFSGMLGYGSYFGGRIIITTQRLLFEPQRLNTLTPVSLFLKDIVSIRIHKSLGLIPDGFLVKCRSDMEYRFNAFKRKQVLDLLAKQTRLPIA
jgi:hypothetical protein